MIKGQRARTDRGSPLSDRPWRLGALVTGDFQCAWSACSMWCLAREAGTDRSFDEPKLDPHDIPDLRSTVLSNCSGVPDAWNSRAPPGICKA